MSKNDHRLSVFLTEANEIRTVPILEVEDASPTVKTITVRDEICAEGKPGQFLMLWIPGVAEIPLSISDVTEDAVVSVAVKNVGSASSALHAKKTGEWIGVRGPFGNGFTLDGGRILVISGGTGVAPTRFLCKEILKNAPRRVVCIIGAGTRDELLFRDSLGSWLSAPVSDRMKLIFTTEDGSFGLKGLATDVLSSLLKEERFDMIYTCGPEKMMRLVFDVAERNAIALEASLERLMRCAIGICGSCVIGRFRVCRDGPVFGSEQLREVKDTFGVSKRDFSGGKAPIDTLARPVE